MPIAIPLVTRRIKDMTCIQEHVGSIHGLIQWVKDAVLLQAVAQGADTVQIPHGCGCSVGLQLQLLFDP